MSTATTRGLTVDVEPRYHPERSDPSRRQWFFSYTVTVANAGSQPVQLLRRHWVITTADGREQHVRGPGVVGEQPRLEPGERFTYTSFCPLDTSLGAMHGSYEMAYDDGTTFEAAIAPFTLAEPGSLN